MPVLTSRDNTKNSLNKDDKQNSDEEQNVTSQPAVRNILGFMERYDRIEQQELLSQINCHWLLSLEDFKLPIEHPFGLITQMLPPNEDFLVVLVPYEEDIGDLDYREMHQIIRELTIGMYVLNQHPSLQLEANFDDSTSCQIPPAYIDTKLGQIMINCDYWLKALWHGSFFTREKRIKFSERWRQLMDVDSNGICQTKKNVLAEFLNAGLTDIAKDPDYSYIFNTDDDDSTSGIGFGVDMNSLHSKPPSKSMMHDAFAELNYTDDQIQDEINNFMNYIDDISLQISFGLNSIKQFKNVYEISADYEINSCCRADNNRIDNEKFERLLPILNSHEKYLRENFSQKQEIKRYLTILKIVSFLVPLFIGLKKRMKIPDLNNLLPLMTGDDVHTERELPPLILSSDFKSKTFAFSGNNSNNGNNKNTSSSNNNNTTTTNNNNSDKTEKSNNISSSSGANPYFNLHGGIQFELDTCQVNHDSSNGLASEYNNISSKCTDILQYYLQSEQQLQEYKIPVVQVNNKKYWGIRIDLESYYAQYPQKPYWVAKLNDDLNKLRPKRLPMNDIQIYDLFKKHFGYKKATKFKSVSAGLRASSQRGIQGIFQSFARKTPAIHLSRHDEFGLGLIHHSAIFNRSSIITNLVMIGVDVNLKQQIDYMAIGPMPIHYASRSGSLDALSCLLANYGNISFYDDKGWIPIHHAAFFNNTNVIKLLVRRQYELIEATTRNDYRKSPLLIAASSGSIEAVKCLIKLGANISFQDESGYNIIHVAAHRRHTNIIDFFIKNEYPEIDTWKLLINMLSSDKELDREASVKCLKLLTNNDKKYWSHILNAGGIEKLCSILKKFSQSLVATNAKTNKIDLTEKMKVQLEKQNNLILDSLSVLCNLSDQHEIRSCLSQINDLTDVLIKILDHSNSEDMQSRVAILIGDVASVDDNNKVLFADKGCLDTLMNLLDRDVEDLLVNAVNAIEVLCKNNIKNQQYCCQKGILESLIGLLNLNSDLLKSVVSAAISAITHNNTENQLLALRQNIIKPLVDLLKSRNMTVQLKVSMALESLAISNINTQEAILDLDATFYLIKLLEDHTTVAAIFDYQKCSNSQFITFYLEFFNDIHSKVVTFDVKSFTNQEIKSNMEDWSIVIREQAALTLWTLAGNQKTQRKSISERIGISQIISMLMSKSEKLQYVGCKCMNSLVLENVNYQNQILAESGIDPLVRLLKLDKTSHRVKLAIVETIGALCVDIAHVNNELTQRELAEKEAIELILELLEKPPNSFIQIETAHALACLILNRTVPYHIEQRINIRLILDLIKIDDLELRLKAGLAISVLAYNNHQRQYDIINCNGISFEYYKTYFDASNKNLMHLCRACFQVVVLAKVINDRDQVWLTALGISKLVKLLLNNQDHVVIQSASYLSSLAHTRAGIKDAMITCDAINILCDRLYATNEEIKFTCAVTLSYLSYNRTASRLLLHNCRNVPTLFDTLMAILGDNNKICQQFVESYHTAVELGLPKLLVRNKINFYVSTRQHDEDGDSEQSEVHFHRPDLLVIQERTKSNLSKTSSLNAINRSQSAPMIKLLKQNNNSSNTPLATAYPVYTRETTNASKIDTKLTNVTTTPITTSNRKTPIRISFGPRAVTHHQLRRT